MDRHQTKLQKAKVEEDRLKKEIAEMQTNVAQLDAESKRYRDLINDLDFRLNPIKVNKILFYYFKDSNTFHRILLYLYIF